MEIAWNKALPELPTFLHPTSGGFDPKDDKLETGFFMLGLDSLELVRVRNRSG